MSTILCKGIKASWLAGKLNKKLIGTDMEIRKVCPLNHSVQHSLTFANTVPIHIPESLVIIGDIVDLPDHCCSVIQSSHPRIDFIRALQILDNEVGFQSYIDPPRIDPSVKIGKYTVIGNNVEIGARSVIGHHVVIADGVKIGNNCYIKSGAVIGEEGFGFERDEQGIPIRMKHLGSVIMGDYVEIGSLSTVCRGTLGDTVIRNYVKIDDHVHISHNCFIDESAIVTACSNFGGGTEVGKGSWIGLHATTMQKVKIGEHALVGMGSVVLRNVNAKETVFGNPARTIIK